MKELWFKDFINEVKVGDVFDNCGYSFYLVLKIISKTENTFEFYGVEFTISGEGNKPIIQKLFCREVKQTIASSPYRIYGGEEKRKPFVWWIFKERLIIK